LNVLCKKNADSSFFPPSVKLHGYCLRCKLILIACISRLARKLRASRRSDFRNTRLSWRGLQTREVNELNPLLANDPIERTKDNALQNDLQSVNSSNNVGGDINLGSLASGTPRTASQQSLKNHSRHQPASNPPSTPRNVCQMTEVEGPCIRKLLYWRR